MKASVVPCGNRGVEVTRNVDRVVHDQVQLLGTEHNTGDAAEEAENDDREEYAGESRVSPRTFAKPLEQALRIPFAALSQFDGARNGKTVDHGTEDRQVEGVRGVENLVLGAQSRLHQEVVSGSELQEQDVHQERRTANLLGDRTGAEQNGCSRRTSKRPERTR